MKTKVGILYFKNTNNISDDFEINRFIEELKKVNLKPEIFFFSFFSIFFSKGKLEIYYKNKKFNVNKYLFFLARYNLTQTGIYDNYSIARYLKLKGLKIYNSPQASFLAKNKRDSLILLALAGLPITPTGINYSQFFLDGHLKRNKNNKIVAKANSSSLGYSVSLLDSSISFISFMEFVGSQGINPTNVLIQPFIKSHNMDYRIFVVGNKVVAAMKRQAKGIEFRSNISKGGVGSKVKLNKKMAQLAIQAVKVLKLDYAGVDIIKDTKGKTYIVEVNSNPGLEIENITGFNIVKTIIKHCVKKS